MTSRFPLLILNGFDRSGTTMVAQVLASHPRVESLVQPFSSTVVHDTQWESWDPGESHPEVEAFVEGLLAGEIDRSFLASDWFGEHSSTSEMVAGHLHVVKSTKLHFKVEWFGARFPDVPFRAVYRDPRAVVSSLLRNDFYRDWYGEPAYREVVRRVRQDRAVPASLREATLAAEGELEKAAAVVAVRSEGMLRSVPRSRVLRYEDVVERPNRVLNDLLAEQGLDRADFEPAMERDYNMVGEPYAGPYRWREWLDPGREERIARFFRDVGPPEGWP